MNEFRRGWRLLTAFVVCIGLGTAPALFAAVHDATGGYGPALLLTAVLFATAAISMLAFGCYPTFAQDPPDGLFL